MAWNFALEEEKILKKAIATVGVIAVVLGVLLGAFIYKPTQMYDQNSKRFVCIINPGTYYWADVWKGMEAADQEFGSDTKYNEFARFDTEEQIHLLKKVSYMQADGVITIGEPYSEEVNEAIREIVDAGIPVVLVDTDSKESGRACYVGSDNYEAGRLAAEKMREETGGEAKIAVFISQINSANQQERLRGFEDVIESEEGMEIVTIIEGEADKLKIQEDFKSMRRENPQIDAIFCAEATSSVQIGVLLGEQEAEKLTIVGFDVISALNYVETGLYEGVIVQDGFAMGYEAVKFLCEYEEDQEDKEIFTDVVCITKDNVDEYRQKREN